MTKKDECRSLVRMLMEHRVEAYAGFVEDTHEIMDELFGPDFEREWFTTRVQMLGDSLKNVDVAILGVLLADSLEQAKSIVEGFHTSLEPVV